ncbi:isoprenylcysteine carboxylmethyltransferase family protein [bacterium]|nr:isoprenylcysteine carboxylmethyltransferase family protein [bacterium]
MDNRIPAFVFRHRRFVPIATLMLLVILKICLHGTTSLLMLIAGALIVASGMGFRIYSAGYLWGRHTVTEVESDFLCASGPFAYIRNPLYLGNFAVGMGVCVSLNEWYAYAIFIAEYAFLYSIIIPYEERFLEEKFGDAYAEYKARTRRFLPRLKGYKGGARVSPNYKSGAASEKYYLVILGMTFILFYLLFVR